MMEAIFESSSRTHRRRDVEVSTEPTYAVLSRAKAKLSSG